MHNNLGRCYQNGEGVEKDLKKAVQYYTLAANQEHANARCNLGRCYQNGKGVEKDLQKAVEYYTLAANQEDAETQNRAICENGEGVGNADAQCNLGRCYESGQGVEKDLKKAVQYYKLAANQGHLFAQNNLALCFEKGVGVE